MSSPHSSTRPAGWGLLLTMITGGLVWYGLLHLGRLILVELGVHMIPLWN